MIWKRTHNGNTDLILSNFFKGQVSQKISQLKIF